jgi:site-specific recombinase XerD
MIEDFLAALRRDGYSVTSVSVTAGWLERCRQYFEPRPLHVLRARDLEDWHQSLSWVPGPKGKLYAENTVNQAVGAVRLFFRWALLCGLIGEDPSKGLRTRRIPKRPRPEIELQRLLILLSGDHPVIVRDRAVYGLLFETGLPLLACARLDLKDLQTDTGALLASGKRPGVYSLSQGLTNDLERYLQHARPLLAVKATKGEQALFLNRHGSRMHDGVIRARLRDHRRQLALNHSSS